MDDEKDCGEVPENLPNVDLDIDDGSEDPEDD